MSMAQVYLGLGSNLGNREQYLRDAVSSLAVHGVVCARSFVYETEPFGIAEQPWFLNAAIGLKTNLSPHALLETCLGIENALGRVREQKNGPRTIDIDILLYDGVILSDDRLQIPHPGMPERSTVLAPMCDIAPDTVHPVLGKTMRTLFAEMADTHAFVKRDDVLLG